MLKLGIVQVVCERDENCYAELQSLVEFLRELDRKLDDIKVEGSLGTSAPIVVGVPEETLNEMSDKLFEALKDLGYDIDRESVEKGAKGEHSLEDQASSFVSFAFRRLLYRVTKNSQHPLLSEPWAETYCPVCGLVPIASIKEHEDEESSRVRYKCICGNSWETERFMCPNCKNDEAKDFEVQRLGGVSLYTCKRCGYLTLVASSRDIAGQEDEEILPVVAAIAISAVMGPRGGFHEGDWREESQR